MNKALVFLEENGESISDYDGICGELVNDVIHWLGEDLVSIVYVERMFEYDELPGPGGQSWKYHMAALIGGKVHDPWFPQHILAPSGYAAKAFPALDIRISIYENGDVLEILV